MKNEWIVGRDESNLKNDPNPHYISHVSCKTKLYFSNRVCLNCHLPIPKNLVKMRKIFNFMVKL